MRTTNLARRSSALLLVAATVLAAPACTFRVTAGDATTAHPTASSPAAAPGAETTIADYIRDAGITETPVHAGDTTAPTIQLPALAGWVDATAQAGENVYVAVKYAGEELTAADYTPNVVVLLSRLTGRTIDGDALLAFAPGEVRNLTGSQEKIVEAAVQKIDRELRIRV